MPDKIFKTLQEIVLDCNENSNGIIDSYCNCNEKGVVEIGQEGKSLLSKVRLIPVVEGQSLTKGLKLEVVGILGEYYISEKMTLKELIGVWLAYADSQSLGEPKLKKELEKSWHTPYQGEIGIRFAVAVKIILILLKALNGYKPVRTVSHKAEKIKGNIFLYSENSSFIPCCIRDRNRPNGSVIFINSYEKESFYCQFMDENGTEISTGKFSREGLRCFLVGLMGENQSNFNRKVAQGAEAVVRASSFGSKQSEKTKVLAFRTKKEHGKIA